MSTQVGTLGGDDTLVGNDPVNLLYGDFNSISSLRGILRGGKDTLSAIGQDTPTTQNSLYGDGGSMSVNNGAKATLRGGDDALKVTTRPPSFIVNVTHSNTIYGDIDTVSASNTSKVTVIGGQDTLETTSSIEFFGILTEGTASNILSGDVGFVNAFNISTAVVWGGSDILIATARSVGSAPGTRALVSNTIDGDVASVLTDHSRVTVNGGNDTLNASASAAARGSTAFNTLNGDIGAVEANNSRTVVRGGNDTLKSAADAIAFLTASATTSVNGDLGSIKANNSTIIVRGGNDTLEASARTNFVANNTLNGDVSSVNASSHSNVTVWGGSDSLVATAIIPFTLIPNSASFSNTLNGDVGTVTASNGTTVKIGSPLIKAGNDTLVSGTTVDILAGDVGVVTADATSFIFVNAGDDVLIGGAGNDKLYGDVVSQSGVNISITGGNDTLNGTDAASFGVGELDELTGGGGADQFVLGDSLHVYYASNSNSDYALIHDFTASEDILQLRGSATDYILDSSYVVAGINGVYTAILTNSELIGVLEGVSLDNTAFTTTPNAFTFV